MMNRISDFLFTDFQIDTPYYCFNMDIFCDRVNMLRRKTNGKAKICYSLKSNPWFVEAAHRCCDYIEVCSAGEWKLCLSSGVPSEFLSIGGITKTKSECHEISDNGCLIFHCIWLICNETQVNETRESHSVNI